MRIGIYDPYLDDLGGGEKYMMTIAEYLAKNNEVTVFWDNKEDLVKVSLRFSLDFKNVGLGKNIFSQNIKLKQRLVETRKYDVIIILIDGSIPLVSSKKLFLHIQQPLTQIRKLTVKDKLKLSRVTQIFYNSLFTKSFNDKIYGKKSRVIYPPVQILDMKSKKENIITTVGRFRAINIKNDDFKKQNVMVDVFKKMVDGGLKNWKFIVATSTNNQIDTRFLNMLETSKGYPIEFLVNKNNKELWELYNKAKIYWHASGVGEDLEKRPEYAEHFGISTVEAMGAGCVPVVYNAGGQKEIVKNGKNGFLWNSLDELSELTNKLIKNNELWEKISDAAKVRSKDFSKERFYEAIESLLK